MGRLGSGFENGFVDPVAVDSTEKEILQNKEIYMI